ncbi:MAG: ATP-binding cassette domain-containing protein, partial [Clostridia bacterium]
VMDQLRAEGKAIILITHKLREAMKICDTITVLRRGCVVETQSVQEVTPASLAISMVGRPVLFELPERTLMQNEVSLDFQNVTTGTTKKDIRDMSFTIHKGEIFGIAGVEGNGQAALVESILGLKKVVQGEIVLNGRKITRVPTKKRTGKIAHIAEDRHAQGYIGSFSIKENVYLGRQDEPAFRKGNLVNSQALEKAAREIIDRFDVRVASIMQPAGDLSGGNQQKLVIGREFTKPDIEIVIAEHPSRGLDIASSEYTQQCLIRMRNQGKSVLLITADLDELLSVSDRIGVLYEGKMVATGVPDDFPARKLGLYMTGGQL